MTFAVLDVFRRASDVDPRHPSDPRLLEWFGGGRQTASGIAVDEETSLTLAAVYAAVRVLSTVAAYLPVDVYERMENGDRTVDREHPASLLIRDEPNPEQTSFMFRAAIKSDSVLWGNGYAEIERTKGGDPIALWPIHPRRVKPTRTKDKRRKLFYEVSAATDEPGTGKAVIAAEDMLHLPNLPPGGRGIVGKSTIAYARESLGLALGAERTGAAFYANGMKPSGILKHPEQLSKDARDRLQESMQKKFGGSANIGKLMILEEGMDFTSMTIPPEDAQFLQTREFQDEEVARWFGVPQHLIGMLKRSTNNNIEHQSLEFIMFTLEPWLTMEAQEFKRKLLRESEKRDWFIEHNVDGLLKGDTEKRKNLYAAARQWGWLNINEIRRKENLNGIGEQGDIYLQPVNMVDADPEKQPDPNEPKPGEAEPEVDEEETPPKDDKARDAIKAVVAEALGRMAKIEADNAQRYAKEPGKFLGHCDNWSATHWQRFSSAMAPSFAACRAVGVDVDTAVFYATWAEEARTSLVEASGDRVDFDKAIATVVAAWPTERVEKHLGGLFDA
jgi:HK97 family phage portal protein